MSSSIFKGTTLYESMIETDDEEDINKVLLEELKKRDITKEQFIDFKSNYISNFIKEYPHKYMDCCLYFGIKNINFKGLIQGVIETKNLHKITKYGIIYEKFKEYCAEYGFEFFSEILVADLLSKLVCGSIHTVFDIPYKIDLQKTPYDFDYLISMFHSSNIDYDSYKNILKIIIQMAINDYIYRCFFTEDYILNSIEQNKKNLLEYVGVQKIDKKFIPLRK